MREKDQLESQGGVVCCQLEYSPAKLKQLAGVEHRRVQLGEGNHSQAEEEREQPRQPCVALSDDNFCAALKKHWWFVWS